MIAQRLKAAVLALAVICCAPARAAIQPAAATPDGDASRQVLVMLRLPPSHLRADGDYGGYGDEPGHAARRRIAGRIASRHGLTLAGDWAMPLLGLDCYIMTAPADRAPSAVVQDLAHDPDVAWSEPMNLYHTQGASNPPPNDPLYPAQPAAKAWRLDDLHRTTTGRGVRIAVIDSMIDAGHPDLAGQVAQAENFVDGPAPMPENHGTGVAGVIAAKADNGMGIVGVAPSARLLALRACWQQPGAAGRTVCDSLSLAKALSFAITHDARVINMSLSGPPDILLGKLVQVAINRGATVVAAYDRKLPSGGFPASEPGVVAVVDEATGPAIEGVFGAPGRDIPTTQPGGRWYVVSGDSYAAAHVSGLVALALEKAPRLRDAAKWVAWPGRSIDACATLDRIAAECHCGCTLARDDAPFQRR